MAASARRRAPPHESAALHSEKAPTVRATSQPTIITINAAILTITALFDSLSQCADDQSCCFGSREVLLTGDEVAIPNSEPAPQSRANEAGAEALHRVLDAPRHDMLVGRKKIHRPDCIVCIVFLDIREAGYRFPEHERCTGAQARVSQNSDTVTQRAGNLAALVEVDKRPLEIRSLFVGEHRTLATRDHDRVIGGRIDVLHPCRRFYKRREFGGRDKPPCDQVL